MIFNRKIGVPFQYKVWNQDLLECVLDLVHPGNFKVLPPSPDQIACKGEFMGIAKYGEFFRLKWDRKIVWH